MIFIFKYLFLLILLISSLIGSERKQSIKIHISSINDIIELNEMDIEFDHHRTLYEIHAYADEEEIYYLRLNGYDVDVIENESFLYFNELKTNPNYINTNVNPWIGLIDMPQIGIRVHIKAHQVFGCVENIADTGMNNNICINDTISNKTLWDELEKVGEHGELKLRKKCNLVGQCTVCLKG